MSADAVGYSRLMQADEVGTLQELKRRRSEILAPLVAKYQGRIVKVMGDGVLVEFGSAVNAVQCALDVQTGMAKAGLPAAQEPALVAAARRAGVGVYPLSPLYDPDNAQGRPDAAGLVMGYAALDARRIERGVERLAAAVEEVRIAG